MGAVVLDRKIKPEQWGFDSGLVSPEWQEFWGSSYYGLPFWAGGQPYDLIRRQFLAVNGDPQFTSNIGGVGWDFDGTGDYFLHPDRSFGSKLAKHTVTFLFNTTTTAQDVLWGVFNDGPNLGAQLFLNTNSESDSDANKMRYFVRDNDAQNLGAAFTSDVTFNDGKDHIVSFIFDGVKAGSDGIICVLDSIEVPLTYGSTETAVNFSDFEYDPAIGARNLQGSVDFLYTGFIYYALFNETNLSVALVKKLHADPFGPFRMVDEAAFFVPAAVAVPVINLVMAPYTPT